MSTWTIQERGEMNEQEKFKYFGELFLKCAEGEELHCNGRKAEKNHWPNYDSKPEHWTTVKKVHRLQCLVGTQILCEFSGSGQGEISWLSKITPNGFYARSGNFWTTCTPVKNYWNDWSGGECPVPEGMKYQVRLKKKDVRTTPAAMDLRWHHDRNSDSDIISVMFLEDS